MSDRTERSGTRILTCRPLGAVKQVCRAAWSLLGNQVMFTHCPVGLAPMRFASPSESPICGDGALAEEFRLRPTLFVTLALPWGDAGSAVAVGDYVAVCVGDERTPEGRHACGSVVEVDNVAPQRVVRGGAVRP